MDKGRDVFAVECIEREGPVIRTVRFAPFTVEGLRKYWDRLSKFPVLFNRGLQSFDDFLKTYISTLPDGSIIANGLMWEVDDVGIIWLTDIAPEYQATAHIAFWDRKLVGREVIFKKMIKHIFEEYNFHRIVVEVPLYAIHMILLTEVVGFTLEGRLRKAAWYKNKWYDVNIYSVLEEEKDNLKTKKRKKGWSPEPLIEGVPNGRSIEATGNN